MCVLEIPGPSTKRQYLTPWELEQVGRVKCKWILPLSKKSWKMFVMETSGHTAWWLYQGMSTFSTTFNTWSTNQLYLLVLRMKTWKQPEPCITEDLSCSVSFQFLLGVPEVIWGLMEHVIPPENSGSTPGCAQKTLKGRCQGPILIRSPNCLSWSFVTQKSLSPYYDLEKKKLLLFFFFFSNTKYMSAAYTGKLMIPGLLSVFCPVLKPEVNELLS